MVRIKSFTQNPQDIAAYGALMLADGRKITLSVKGMGGHGEIDGVNSRDEAEALRGAYLYIERCALPEIGDDTIYQADVVGRMLIEPNLGEIGIIRAVYDFGAGAMLEVATEEKHSIFVPFGGDNRLGNSADGVTLTIDPIWLEGSQTQGSQPQGSQPQGSQPQGSQTLSKNSSVGGSPL